MQVGFQRFKDDVRHDGCVIIEGERQRMPRYYADKIREQGVWDHMALAHERGKSAYRAFEETVPKRLEARHAVAKARLSLKKESL